MNIVVPILVNLDSVSNVRVTPTITKCKSEIVEQPVKGSNGVSEFKTATLEDIEVPATTVYPITLQKYLDFIENIDREYISVYIHPNLSKIAHSYGVNVGVLLIELENLPINPVRKDLIYEDYGEPSSNYVIYLHARDVINTCKVSCGKPEVGYDGSTIQLSKIPSDVTVNMDTYKDVVAKHVTEYKIKCITGMFRIGSNVDKVETIDLGILSNELTSMIGLEHLIPGKFTSLKKLKAENSNVAEWFCEMFGIEHIDTLTIRNGNVDMGHVTVDNLRVRHGSEITRSLQNSLKSFRVRKSNDLRRIVYDVEKCRTDNDTIAIDAHEVAKLDDTLYYPIVNLTKLNKSNCNIRFSLCLTESLEADHVFDAKLNLNLTTSFITRIKSSPSARGK